jgi:3-deoxy-D-manno-octulosonate 8-phosphate phosphatase (KDO 8-P phosphatase)
VTADELPDSLREAVGRVQFVAFDFDGVFTDNRVIVSEDGTESVACTRADGFGIQALRDAGVGLAVLSTEINPVVGVRCRKLGLDCVQGLTDKAAALRRQIEARGTTAERTAYMGNDVNDIACLESVGVAVGVADSHRAILPYVSFVTGRCGGCGAVREFCDLVIACRQRNGVDD